MQSAWINALLGGVLIGVSASLMLLYNGRITGISGIVYGLFKKSSGDIAWRVTFISGLILGGVILQLVRPQSFGNLDLLTDWTVIAAGLLVGFGTILGGGCTSGHGVCGISRLSLRSIIATLVFISSGVLIVTLLRTFGVLP